MRSGTATDPMLPTANRVPTAVAASLGPISFISPTMVKIMGSAGRRTKPMIIADVMSIDLLATNAMMRTVGIVTSVASIRKGFLKPTLSDNSGISAAPTIPPMAVSYTHLRAHETRHELVGRLLLEKRKQGRQKH